ncbi:FixH family protein [Telmatospirillum sp.]|uniref:FixH family protein n=1 Tax=Telmatospirillum sp. TaxID=2079197 RepID=UPI002849A393|nr:FixH family protein [Telmatospirillum sp.]MDR3435229.1 FixH family protein [Telmatospirillum sp.]
MTEFASARRRPGWWYPFIFVGAFGVVLAVNLVFMASAVRTFSGLSSEHAYDEGLKYNERIAAARAQEKLGWTTKAEVQPAGGAVPHSANIVLTVLDRDGKPVTGLSVQADFVRPTAAGHDSSAPLAEQGQGRYMVAASLALGGQWDMTVTARRSGQVYQFAQRIFLP